MSRGYTQRVEPPLLGVVATSYGLKNILMVNGSKELPFLRDVGDTDHSLIDVDMILSILVYTFFSRMFDLMLPPVAKHSIVVA